MSGKITGGVPRTLHDAFFKKVFGNPVHAAAELRALLPELAEEVDWDTMAPAPTNFVTAVLRQRLGDLVSHARLRDDGEVLVWFLFEHQSSESWWMALEIVKIEVAMWDRWRADHPQARQVPAIVPVVVYHGPQPWRAPTDVAELVRSAGGVGAYVMRCRFVLDDLSALDDEALRERHMSAFAKLALLALGRAAAEGFAERLARWGPELRVAFIDPDSDDATTFVLYLMHVNPRNDPETLASVVRDAAGPEAERTVMTAAQRLIHQGFEKGQAQGFEKGQAQGFEKGLRLLLVRQLEQRFGSLPARDAARVAAATSAELERWALRVLHADQLASVFDD